jgi:aryl carrier-like protein
MSRQDWLQRLHAVLAECQPGLAELPLTEDTHLVEDLGLDSLAFEELFSRLKQELGPLPMIQWFNRLEREGARVSVLLDLILSHEQVHAR